MKKTIYLIFLFGLFINLMNCKDTKIENIRAEAKKHFQPISDKMPGFENVGAEQIELGKKLYFDTALSINDTQSCNSCHQIDNNGAGVDGKSVSDGAIEGKKGDRNAPTVLNAGFHIAQFWDGRAKDLVEQAKGPILNPVEMAMPSEKAVIEKIKKIQEYPEMFKKAFPEEKEPLTYHNLARAIAAFESTLITKDRFDDFLKGDDKALTKEELKGLETFIQVGCTSCHNGALVGGGMYQKLGLLNAYENKNDLGRYNVTKKEEDKYVFKVPSLRNVALTAPYFHDGSVQTLEEAVRKMAHLQLNKQLSDEEVKKIVTFLNALTDKNLAKK